MKKTVAVITNKKENSLIIEVDPACPFDIFSGRISFNRAHNGVVTGGFQNFDLKEILRYEILNNVIIEK